MTSTISDSVAAHEAAHRAARTPTYDGPGAGEILRRMRAMAGFCEFASNAVTARDVERALTATRRARAELEEIEAALERARPAEVLDELAAESRRISADWQPDPARGGDPLVDVAQADPVTVAAADLADLLRACCCGIVPGPLPDGVGRVAVHMQRQQPQRLQEFVLAGKNRHPEVRAALLRAERLAGEASELT